MFRTISVQRRIALAPAKLPTSSVSSETNASTLSLTSLISTSKPELSLEDDNIRNDIQVHLTSNATAGPTLISWSSEDTHTSSINNCMNDHSNDKDKVHLVGHCAICLKRFPPTETDKRPFNDLNESWRCLQETFGKQGIKKYSFVHRTGNLKDCERPFPPLCDTCQAGLIQLARIRKKFMEMQRKLGVEIGRILGVLGASRRSEYYFSLERSLLEARLPEPYVRNTITFIDQLQTVNVSQNWQIAPQEVPAFQQVRNPEQSPTPTSSERVDFDNNEEEEVEVKVKCEVDSDSNLNLGSPCESTQLVSDLEEEVPLESRLTTIVTESPPDPLAQRPSLRKDKIETSKQKPVAKRQYKKRKQEVSSTEPKKEKRLRLQGPHQRCEHCNERIPITLILEHVQGHVGDYAIQCNEPKCGYVFMCRSQMEGAGGRSVRIKHRFHCRFSSRHKVNVKKEFFCEECDFKTTSPHTILWHFRDHESTEKRFTCPIRGCGKQFTVKRNVEYHLLESHIYKKCGPPTAVDHQKCPICSKQIHLSDLEQHYVDEHNKPASEIIKCYICETLFPTWETLIDHQCYEHREKLRDGIMCCICHNGNDKLPDSRPRPTRFLNTQFLREHYFSEHQKGKKLVCEECGTTVFTKPSLAAHKLKVHGSPNTKKDSKLKFKCDLCEPSVIFQQAQTLISHNIKMHGATPFKCLSCEETFSKKADLNAHHRSVHRGIPAPDPKSKKKRRHHCSLCSSHFSMKCSLKKHLSLEHQVHDTFSCRICHEEFPTFERYRQHQRQEHDSGPVMCEECGKSVLPSLLKQHMRIHTGERPFACDLCGLRFRQRSAFITHKKSHKRLGDNFKPQRTFDRGGHGRKKV